MGSVSGQRNGMGVEGVPIGTVKRHRIYGVDFSAAADAGKKIWIASATVEEWGLRIEDCCRAENLKGSGRDLNRCLAALRNFIEREGVCAFGFDFPFGLPRSLVNTDSWEDFVLSFPQRYSSPEEFHKSCLSDAGGSELRRVTDVESQTPFSPYNLRLYRQTYFGIRDLLGPLLRNQLVCVLPMQRPLSVKPWLLEVCPASTLKRIGVYSPYKGRKEKHHVARAHILESLEEMSSLSIPTALRREVIGDHHGDAIDSVIAAFTTFRALLNPAGLASYYKQCL
ncbi:MAG: hypothetical protein EFT35_10655 [Methanophagales archaeon ANME-1-THS]|nr:MAG: hypothetical protein EFT35_10655 [Methanophagales archaeon ANME-1-THS]